jgi:hypothetical protein
VGQAHGWGHSQNRGIEAVMSGQRFFYWRIFAKFGPEKKFDFDLCKGFLMEKMAQTCQISKNFFFTLPDFYDKFQWVAKNLEGFCFSPTFKSSMWPVLAKLFSG